MDACIFCKIANGDIPTEFVFESADLVAFRDINPEAPVHILIIPRAHLESVNDLESENAFLIGEMALAAKRIAEKENLLEDGYRLVMNTGKNGGQEVPHLHMHLLGGRSMQWPPG